MTPPNLRARQHLLVPITQSVLAMLPWMIVVTVVLVAFPIPLPGAELPLSVYGIRYSIFLLTLLVLLVPLFGIWNTWYQRGTYVDGEGNLVLRYPSQFGLRVREQKLGRKERRVERSDPIFPFNLFMTGCVLDDIQTTEDFLWGLIPFEEATWLYSLATTKEKKSPGSNTVAGGTVSEDWLLRALLLLVQGWGTKQLAEKAEYLRQVAASTNPDDPQRAAIMTRLIEGALQQKLPLS